MLLLLLLYKQITNFYTLKVDPKSSKRGFHGTFSPWTSVVNFTMGRSENNASIAKQNTTEAEELATVSSIKVVGKNNTNETMQPLKTPSVKILAKQNNTKTVQSPTTPYRKLIAKQNTAEAAQLPITSTVKVMENTTEPVQPPTTSPMKAMEVRNTTGTVQPLTTPPVKAMEARDTTGTVQPLTTPPVKAMEARDTTGTVQPLTTPPVKAMEARDTTGTVQPLTTPPVKVMEARNTTRALQHPITPPLNVQKIESVQSPKTPFMKVMMKSELVGVPWTSVGGKEENDSFHLFSAYYDSRNASMRPAVIVLGYAWNQVAKKPLYCKFKYEDGLIDCMKKPLVMQAISSCFAPNLGGLPYFFFCLVPQHSAPVSVVISENSTCNAQFTSKEIIVRNRNQSKQSSKKFGICVGGSVIGHNESLQDLVEFISISKILGADLITMYIIPEQLDNRTVNYLLMRYSDILRLIEWKNLGKWFPLHYYGQILIMQDCLYRSMYEVDYLFHQDIDEVFIPKGGNSWAEIVNMIPQLNQGAGFKYENAFFTPDKIPSSVNLTNYCGHLKIPKYLTRTVRLPCFPGYSYRSKLMTKPSLTLEVSIHNVCATMPGYSGSIPVPSRLAILGHFRNQIPEDCISQRKKTVPDLWASKYTDRLHQEIC